MRQPVSPYSYLLQIFCSKAKRLCMQNCLRTFLLYELDPAFFPRFEWNLRPHAARGDAICFFNVSYDVILDGKPLHGWFSVSTRWATESLLPVSYSCCNFLGVPWLSYILSLHSRGLFQLMPSPLYMKTFCGFSTFLLSPYPLQSRHLFRSFWLICAFVFSLSPRLTAIPYFLLFLFARTFSLSVMIAFTIRFSLQSVWMATNLNDH